MKAAVCYEFGKPLVIEEIEIDSPRHGEVKVRMVAVAICHSDTSLIRGKFWKDILPVVAGHEAAGVVEEVGDGVVSVKPGDPVVASLLRSCGRCFFCTSGTPYLCDAPFAQAQDIHIRNKKGDPLKRGFGMAAFADYSIVDQSQLVPLPADMPLDRAALLACGVITGLGAVVNTAQVRPGSSVVVIGTGGVGLNAVQGAVLAGARIIAAVDLLDNKLEAAQRFGATHTINAGQQDPVEKVKELTAGRGADYALVTVGSVPPISQAFEMIRRGGTLVIVGLSDIEAKVNLPVFHFLHERRIIGSPMGSTRLSVDVPRLTDLYQQGRLKLDELITARYPLEQINEAIEVMERGEALRNVIIF